jgi:hypothetical protein
LYNTLISNGCDRQQGMPAKNHLIEHHAKISCSTYFVTPGWVNHFTCIVNQPGVGDRLRQLNYCFNGDRYQIADSQLHTQNNKMVGNPMSV